MRKVLWGGLATVVAALVAFVITANNFWDSFNGLESKGREALRNWLGPEDNGVLTLKNAKLRREMSAGDKRYDLIVEAVATLNPLKACAGELDTGYLSPITGHVQDSEVEKFDIGDDGYFRVVFTVDPEAIKDGDKMRIRCEKNVSDWVPVDMTNFTRSRY